MIVLTPNCLVNDWIVLSYFCTYFRCWLYLHVFQSFVSVIRDVWRRHSSIDKSYKQNRLSGTQYKHTNYESRAANLPTNKRHSSRHTIWPLGAPVLYDRIIVMTPACSVNNAWLLVILVNYIVHIVKIIVAERRLSRHDAISCLFNFRLRETQNFE